MSILSIMNMPAFDGLSRTDDIFLAPQSEQPPNGTCVYIYLDRHYAASPFYNNRVGLFPRYNSNILSSACSEQQFEALGAEYLPLMRLNGSKHKEMQVALYGLICPPALPCACFYFMNKRILLTKIRELFKRHVVEWKNVEHEIVNSEYLCCMNTREYSDCGYSHEGVVQVGNSNNTCFGTGRAVFPPWPGIYLKLTMPNDTSVRENWPRLRPFEQPSRHTDGPGVVANMFRGVSPGAVGGNFAMANMLNVAQNSEAQSRQNQVEPANFVGQLDKLSTMRLQGLLTEEEFQTSKAKVLAMM